MNSEYAVKVPIVAALSFKGALLAEVEGYALSASDGPEFSRVAIDGPDGTLIELPLAGDDKNPDTCSISRALWREGEKQETQRDLEDAWRERFPLSRKQYAMADAYRDERKEI